MRPVDQLYDVVVTTNSGYPLDQNLYQSVKGMSAAAKVVKPGGTIFCAAECRDGIPEHGAYGEILASRSSPRELLEMITAPGYSRADQWQVQIQAQIQLRARVLLKSDCLSSEQIRAAHFEPVADASTAIAEALRDAEYSESQISDAVTRFENVQRNGLSEVLAPKLRALPQHERWLGRN